MNESVDKLPPVLIALMKGVVYKDSDAERWHDLLQLQARIREYVGVLGLELVSDEAEGYAYLHQRPTDDASTALPRLVARRQLSYPVSLLLALLRKKLAEFDATSADTRLILGRDEIVDICQVFLPTTSNEAKQIDRIDAHISKIVELGFLRRLGAKGDAKFEVRRILKAFVDAQWLHTFDERLKEYYQLASDDGADR